MAQNEITLLNHSGLCAAVEGCRGAVTFPLTIESKNMICDTKLTF